MSTSYVEMRALDLVVYGQVQSDFTVEGVTGKTLAEAAVNCAYKRAIGVETEMTSFSAALKLRSNKAEELSSALSEIMCAAAALSDETMSSDKKYNSTALHSASAVFAKYSIDISSSPIESDGITKVNALKLQQTIKLEVDKEDNSLQQDTSTLQSFISKRDSAYSLISKLQSKVNGTFSNTISAIGG